MFSAKICGSQLINACHVLQVLEFLLRYLNVSWVYRLAIANQNHAMSSLKLYIFLAVLRPFKMLPFLCDGKRGLPFCLVPVYSWNPCTLFVFSVAVVLLFSTATLKPGFQIRTLYIFQIKANFLNPK